MSKFNLDPRAAPPPAPPPVVVPRAPPPASPPPPAPVAPVEPARGRRKLLLVGAAVVAILLIGGAVAIYAATNLGYPERYLLDEDERPAGYTNARLSANEMEELGIERNPGEVSRDVIERREQELGRDGSDAEEAHLQVLMTPSGARVLITAARYESEDAAKSAVNDLRMLCSVRMGSVLRDGNVVVTLLHPDGVAPAQARTVLEALRAQNGDLVRMCG